MTADALTALQRANDPPQLFGRSGRMVAVVADERQRMVISEVSESSLRGRMARSALYFKLGGEDRREPIPCSPPMDVVKDLMALPAAEWKFPPLEAIVEAPCLRPDGTICDRPGYDPPTFLFHAPAPGLCVPDIPLSPMIDDVQVALELLDSAICDFPFANEASRANALASMLTPLVRPAIDGPTPLALYDAPQAGTGKSLLAEVGAIIATGRPAETFSAPTDPEEWRKKITTALATGTSVLVIDNVTRRLDSDALCMAITSPTIADRMFRTFDKMVLPVRCAWIATGNNIQLGGDMLRRCYWIRLDAKDSQPFRRTGFRHLNLRGWVLEQRGQLIAALLTIARYWFLQGGLGRRSYNQWVASNHGAKLSGGCWRMPAWRGSSPTPTSCSNKRTRKPGSGNVFCWSSSKSSAESLSGSWISSRRWSRGRWECPIVSPTASVNRFQIFLQRPQTAPVDSFSAG